MSDESDQETINAAAHIISLVLSKKGAAGAIVLLAATGGGGGFVANLAHTFFGPTTNIEITSPQMQQMIEEELKPVRELVKGQEAELQAQAVQLYDIEEAVLRGEESTAKVAENLAETTAVLNRLAGQMEMVVQIEMQRLGVAQ